MPDRIEDIYLWRIIERMLFSPTGQGDINKWFKQYHRFVLKLWELNPEIHKGQQYSFNFNDIITVSFNIPFNIKNYSIDVSQKPLKQSLHYDGRYLSELDLINIFNDGIDKQLLHNIKQKKISSIQIERILNSMLVHPALHFHLEDLSHYVRLNFNTKNPFLFLYQLAFQLLDYKVDFRDSEKKQLEFKRLVEMVIKNIDYQNQIASGILLNSK